MDPQQEIFTAMRQAAVELGQSVYDTVLPSKDTLYPFTYFGYTQQIDTSTKTQLTGTVIQHVDVWHDNPKKRGDVSAMMLALKCKFFELTHTKHYSIQVFLDDQTIQADDSTGQVLLRGLMSFRIKFS